MSIRSESKCLMKQRGRFSHSAPPGNHVAERGNRMNVAGRLGNSRSQKPLSLGDVAGAQGTADLLGRKRIAPGVRCRVHGLRANACRFRRPSFRRP